MPLCYAYLNNVRKNIIKASVNRELERGMDVATVVFAGDVAPKENDDVKIVLDCADLTYLKTIMHLENTVKDESGLGHDGVASGITYGSVNAKIGYYAIFNGSSYFTIADSADFTLAGQFDLQFWVKFSGSTAYYFVDKRTSTTTGLAIAVSSVTAGKVSVYANATTITSSASVNDNAWHNVRVMRDANNLITIVIDNVADNTATVSGDLSVATAWRFCQKYDATSGYVGNMDTLRIYIGGTLSVNDATNIYNLKWLTSTIKFGGKIWQINDKVTPRECQCKSYGKIIGETTIQAKVYNNQTVTAIIQDLVQTNTSLVFVLGASSSGSITLTQYVAQGLLFDNLVSLASMVDKTFYTDGLAQFHLDDNEAQNINVTYTHGTNCTIRESGVDDTQLVNDVTVQGRDVTYRNQETFTGDGVTTVFTASFIIIDPYITVAGVKQVGQQDFTIDTLNKKVTFTNPPANGASIVIQYSYDAPILVHSSDPTSITNNGIRSKPITAPWITNLGDATRFAQLYLQAFKDATMRYQVRIPYLDVQVDSNLVVTLVNSIKNVNGGFSIKSVTWEYPGITTLQCGEFSLNQFELHKQIVQELHSLQQLQATNTSLVNFKNIYEPLGLVDSYTKKQLQLAYYNSNSYYSNTQVYSE